MIQSRWILLAMLACALVVSLGLILACGDDDDDDDDDDAGPADDDDNDVGGDDDVADDDDTSPPLWFCLEDICQTVVDCGAPYEDVDECVGLNENTPYDCENSQGFVDCACECDLSCDTIDACLGDCLYNNGCFFTP